MSNLKNIAIVVRSLGKRESKKGLAKAYLHRSGKNWLLLGLVVSSFASFHSANAQTMTKVQEVETAGLYVQLMKDMPKSTVLITSPYPQALNVYGGSRSKIDSKSEIKGGHALSIKTGKPRDEPGKKGVVNKTVDKIQSGDTLCLIYWARGKARSDDEVASFAEVGVQQNGAPYARLMSLRHDLSDEWAPYVNKAEVSEAYEAGKAEVFFHFGHLNQQIDIGPVYLFNLGQNIPLDFQSNACGKL